MTRILCVKSQAPLSRLICWGLQEGSSHLALAFAGHVIHSSIRGIEIETEADFFAGYEVVRELDAGLTVEESTWVQLHLMANYAWKHYDYRALAYFAYRAALRRFLGIPLPNRNTWQVEDAYLCVGLLVGFSEAWARLRGQEIIPIERTWEMMSPDDCWRLLKDALPQKATA